MKHINKLILLLFCCLIFLELIHWNNISLTKNYKTLHYNNQTIKTDKKTNALRSKIKISVDNETTKQSKPAENNKELATTAVVSEKEATSHPIPVCPNIYMGNSKLCADVATVTYFVYVHSAPHNLERRMNLRSTWGNATQYKDGTLKIMFVLGRSNTAQKLLEKEMQTYHDILQGDFLDSYHNLTLKGIMALRFVTQYCQNAKYIIKADDDTFIDVFRMFNFIDKHENSSKQLIMCNMYEGNMPILRDPKTCAKWCINEDEFPGKKFYPSYCAGLFYLTTYEVIKYMYKASFSTPFFWIDDVYITGLLMGKAKKKVPTRYEQTDFNFSPDFLYTNASAAKSSNFVGLIESTDAYRKMWSHVLKKHSKQVS